MNNTTFLARMHQVPVCPTIFQFSLTMVENVSNNSKQIPMQIPISNIVLVTANQEVFLCMMLKPRTTILIDKIMQGAKF